MGWNVIRTSLQSCTFFFKLVFLLCFNNYKILCDCVSQKSHVDGKRCRKAFFCLVLPYKRRLACGLPSDVTGSDTSSASGCDSWNIRRCQGLKIKSWNDRVSDLKWFVAPALTGFGYVAPCRTPGRNASRLSLTSTLILTPRLSRQSKRRRYGERKKILGEFLLWIFVFV